MENTWNFIKNNVLYVCQSGTSGYANAAKGYIYELLNKKIKVKSIPFACDISHTVEITSFDKYIGNAINEELTDPEVSIIHATPDIWTKIMSDLKINSKIIIGRTVWEFEKLTPEWVECINNSKVHYVSVPTEWNKQTFLQSGVRKPILVDPHIYVNHPYKEYPLEYFLKSKSVIFSDFEINDSFIENTYKFYSISQFTDRKGIIDLVRVFCETYSEDDDVILLLKTFRDGYSLEEQKKCITAIVETIKSCNNKKYAPVIFIKENLNFDEIQSLHNIGNCYISLPKAEGFGLGIHDAFNLNKPIITTGFGGHVEYLGSNYEGLVKYTLEPVNKESFPKLNFDDSYEWANVDLNHVSKLMIQRSEDRIEYFIQKNPICLGEGTYELENDGKSHYRWTSKEFTIYIFDKKIKSIVLYLLSDFDGKIMTKDETYNLTSGTNNVEIEIKEDVLNLIQKYFVPSLTYQSNDNRELSYKLYAIETKFEDGNTKILNIEKIKYITDNYYTNVKNKKTEINGKIVTEYGGYGEMFVKTSKNNPDGKINLNCNQISFYSHRSGWDYALGGLFEFHNNRGIMADGFLENAFVWRKDDCITKRQLPYRKSWIGFFHNPPNMPTWFSDNSAYPNSILHDKYFKQSLQNCKGLYVLSNYHARFLKTIIPQIPINVLYHPTEIPENKFNFEKFVKNKNKSLVNIGWWLRKLNSFYQLNSPYNKIRLLPNNKCKDTIFRLSKIERALYGINLTEEQNKSVKMVDHLSNDDYDTLLTENIVFLDLYDSSANNAVIECIARATPILINKHPAVIEYLGEEYPFYFKDYDDVSYKLNDIDLIKQTHQYLLNFSLRKNIMLDTFIDDFKKSEIYQKL
jgi:glycosyltransferase involved in cell wall biosynthesis